MRDQREIRRLTPQEIGKAVRVFRKALDMKQITLAHEAGVSERAIQRIESGESVADETLARIAKAFQMESDALTKPRPVMSDEEAIEYARRLKVITARRIESIQDCGNLLGHHGFIFDTDRVTDEGLEVVAQFLDNIRDWNDAFRDLSFSQALEGKRSIFEQAQTVAASGFEIIYGSYATDDKFNVVAITFFSHSDARASGIHQLVVPRLMLSKNGEVSFQG